MAQREKGEGSVPSGKSRITAHDQDQARRP
jgi:hypothetical protein